jgi:hypothetical protein
LTTAIDDRGLRDVVVYDTATGEPAQDVEWRSVVHEGRRLVNVANYAGDSVSLRVEIGGETAGDGRDVLERRSVSGGNLELAGRTPALLSFPAER